MNSIMKENIKTEYKKGYKKTKLGWIPDDWECLKLGDFGSFKNGISKGGEHFGFGTPIVALDNIFEKDYINSSINFTFVNATENELKEFSLQKGDVLFVRSSVKPEGVGLTAVIENDLHNTTFSGFIIRYRDEKKKLENTFKRYCFTTELFRRKLLVKSTISANTNINQPSLASLYVIIPTKKEQNIISKILINWDISIEIIENLIEKKQISKKALMQKLLTGKIRLKKFENEKWKHKKLNQIFKRVNRKNTENNKNILTISAQNGLISQEEFYRKRIASVDASKYLLLEHGEYAYNKSYSKGYPMGAIKRLDLYEKGVVSNLYICFSLVDSNNSNDFFNHYFEMGLLNKEIQMIAQEGARNHGLLNITSEDFFNTLLFVPTNKEEQQEIANILNTCDEEIKLLNFKLKKLKQQKKGLMQKLLTGQVRVKI